MTGPFSDLRYLRKSAAQKRLCANLRLRASQNNLVKNRIETIFICFPSRTTV